MSPSSRTARRRTDSCGKPDCLGDLALGVDTAKQESAGRGRSAEHVAGAGALEAAPEMAGLHRQPDADDGLVAGDDGGQHLDARRADVLGGRERGRPGRDARMQHRAHMGVIGIIARAEADVEERRVLRVEGLRREQHMRSAGTADRRNIVARPAAPGQARAERCHAQKIKQQHAQLVTHVLGQRSRIERCRELGECAGRAAIGCDSHDGSARQGHVAGPSKLSFILHAPAANRRARLSVS